MIKKAALIVLTYALSLVSFSAQAQNVKIGFVNAFEVLYGTDEGKREIERMKQFEAEKRQQLDSQTAGLQKLTEQFANQQRTLNPETRAEMDRTIQERQRSLKRLQEDVQLEYDQRRDTVVGGMSEKMQKIIRDYAPKNGFGVIFLRDQSQSFIDPRMEITQEIIRIYNEQHPIASQGAVGSASQP